MQQNPRNTDDDTPWAQLASLGLFKLFNDWTAQGFNVPKELSKPPDAAPEVNLLDGQGWDRCLLSLMFITRIRINTALSEHNC